MPKFDSLGLPQDHGSTDLQDSARLAGLLAAFCPEHRGLPLKLYIDFKNKRYVRHPLERLYDFSRDQAICFVTGLYMQGHLNLVNKAFIDGKDIFSPSQLGHLRICQGYAPTMLQKAWLWLDVYYHAKVKPWSEPNQLLCMLAVADPKYIRTWAKIHPDWQLSLSEYWYEGPGSWRNEKELCLQIIKSVRALL